MISLTTVHPFQLSIYDFPGGYMGLWNHDKRNMGVFLWFPSTVYFEHVAVLNFPSFVLGFCHQYFMLSCQRFRYVNICHLEMLKID